jgi:hypothetical protein
MLPARFVRMRALCRCRHNGTRTGSDHYSRAAAGRNHATDGARPSAPALGVHHARSHRYHYRGGDPADWRARRSRSSPSLCPGCVLGGGRNMGGRSRVVLCRALARTLGATALATAPDGHVGRVPDRTSTSVAVIRRCAVGVRSATDAPDRVWRRARVARGLLHRKRHQLYHVGVHVHFIGVGFWPDDADRPRPRATI